jgi:hypothetical protein
MRQNGMQAPGPLQDAERSMQEAEEALRRGDLGGAARSEQQALEQLRQGAQQMAEQMMQQMRQFGQGPGGDAPLDPLGRPQRTEGPDLGTSVKIPDEIDVQRAREILEELRKRRADPPPARARLYRSPLAPVLSAGAGCRECARRAPQGRRMRAVNQMAR